MKARGLLVLALVATMFVAACGGDDGSGEVSEEEAAPCQEVEEVAIEESENYHVEGKYSADDYSTQPPAGGTHGLGFLEDGKIYETAPPIGDAVHNLEHGAVIVWTNGLADDQRAEMEAWFEQTVAEDPFAPGDKYIAIIGVENPDMDVPLAVSAWGALQKCNEWDEETVTSFVEAHYASGPEGEIACGDAMFGEPAKVPACK